MTIMANGTGYSCLLDSCVCEHLKVGAREADDMDGRRWRRWAGPFVVMFLSLTFLLQAAAPAWAADGKALYSSLCAACHGSQGEGRGSFPALAQNPVASDEAQVQRRSSGPPGRHARLHPAE